MHLSPAIRRLTALSRLCRPRPTTSHSTAEQTDFGQRFPRNFGDYDLFEQLGCGGMGVVYRARQRSADRIVALKLIRPDRLAEDSPDQQRDALTRFRFESQVAAQLDHDHLVTVYDVGEVEGRPYYSMKYVQGQSLNQILCEGPLEGRRAAVYLEAAARGVHEAHQHGILHRDIKPHNILIESKSDRAQVADFGLAKLVSANSGVSLRGMPLGTLQYMPPEQAIDATRVTVLSDVYSLGATLYHALTGRPPFQAATEVETLNQVIEQEPTPPKKLNAAVDRDLETICLKTLRKDPAERYYKSAADLADDLRRFVVGEPIHARPVGTVERSWRWAKRNRAVAGSLAVVALALAAGTAVSTAFAIREARARNNAESNARWATLSEREARGAVDKFYTRVSEDRLLNEPGMQPLRRDLLRLALEHYQSFAQTRTDDFELSAELARATFRIGAITEAIGSKEKALAAYQRSIEIQERLTRENPARADVQSDLATSHYCLGVLQATAGHVNAALQSYQAGLEIQKTLAHEHPAEVRYLAAVATSLMSIGNLQSGSGQTDRALGSHSQALEIFGTLASKNPQVLSFKRDLARCHNDIANLQLQLRQTDEAFGSYRKALEINQDLARKSHDH